MPFGWNAPPTAGGGFRADGFSSPLAQPKRVHSARDFLHHAHAVSCELTLVSQGCAGLRKNFWCLPVYPCGDGQRSVCEHRDLRALYLSFDCADGVVMAFAVID
jgi:hypothetical protein